MSPPAEQVLARLDVRGESGDLRDLLPKPRIVDDGQAVAVVEGILSQVRRGGDQAVRDLTQRFDHVRIADLRVRSSEVNAALARIPPSLREALTVAHANITSFHQSQLRPGVHYTSEGVDVQELRRPVERAGLYVPGGRAPLASTVLMTAVPARVAGVDRLVMCSPPDQAGEVAPAILAAAAIAGVDEVYRIGGAQAVAAMAYGTETIAPVDVIVGPGNRYVAIAERLVSGQGAVGVPSAFTGPSEVAVVADETTDRRFAAIDLMVQAEHGPDGLSYLITWSEEAAAEIEAEVVRLTADCPRRADIEATLKKGGFCVIVDGPEQAMAVANAVAPEHLQLMCSDPEKLVELVKAAGAVFVGPWSPASVGDYAAGPNHVLPTARSARFGSALGVDDFCRRINVVELNREGLARLGPHVEAMASSEGLAAHAESVRLRTS